MNDSLGEYEQFRSSVPNRRGHTKSPRPSQRVDGERYVMVPVPWLRWASSVCRGKSGIMTALALVHVSCLVKRDLVEVKTSLLLEFGLSRQDYYRGLRALEKGGVVEIQHRSGKRLLVKLLQRPPRTGPDDSPGPSTSAMRLVTKSTGKSGSPSPTRSCHPPPSHWSRCSEPKNLAGDKDLCDIYHRWEHHEGRA
jgi:hypothetical protein